MSEYKSDIKDITAPAQAVYEKLSNLEHLREFLDKVPEDKIPEDKREQLRQMKLTADSISVPGGPTGEVKLTIVKRQPNSLVTLKAADVPIDLNLEIRIGNRSETESTVQVAIVADLPMMLRGMVKGPFNQIVTQFADMLASIPYGQPAGNEPVDC